MSYEKCLLIKMRHEREGVGDDWAMWEVVSPMRGETEDDRWERKENEKIVIDGGGCIMG